MKLFESVEWISRWLWQNKINMLKSIDLNVANFDAIVVHCTLYLDELTVDEPAPLSTVAWVVSLVKLSICSYSSYGSTDWNIILIL